MDANIHMEKERGCYFMSGLQNRQLVTLVIGLLAAVKIILQAFGIDIINDTQMNQIADGIAALATVIAVFMKHEKSSKEQTKPSESGSSTPPENPPENKG
jgi:uncharacterized ion transporter superfamily protein YfcC